jgi:hypothetical protein
VFAARSGRGKEGCCVGIGQKAEMLQHRRNLRINSENPHWTMAISNSRDVSRGSARGISGVLATMITDC